MTLPRELQTMPQHFLVLQHLAVEHPGIFRDFMREDGITWDTVELDEGEKLPEVAGYDALLVMGGPMDVWEEDQHPWLVAEKAAIRRAVRDLGKPYFGFCLGHQLLAAALGGTVGKAAQSEVGIMDVTLTRAGSQHPLLAGVPDQFSTLQWHGAEVEMPPDGGSVLAQSPACAIQALAVGQRAFSIQFHVEIIASTVDDWYAIPAYRAGLHKALGDDGVDAFRQAAAARMPQFNTLARQLYDNWRAAWA
jgi:GMP synthase-like glutamine amidotransferase